MSKDVIGADFDLTWTDFPEIWGKVDVIVTGRSWEEFQDYQDLKEGPDKPVFFGTYPMSDKSMVDRATHKADIINKIGITEYYEDDPRDADIIKILCPGCKLHLVKPGQTQT